MQRGLSHFEIAPAAAVTFSPCPDLISTLTSPLWPMRFKINNALPLKDSV